MLRDISEFHRKFGLGYDGPPRDLPKDLSDLRIARLFEESIEYADAQTGEDRLDALVDIVYIALGSAYLHGYDFEEAWRRVHVANMAKERAPSADASKHGSAFDIVKPEGWTPPDLSDLV